MVTTGGAMLVALAVRMTGGRSTFPRMITVLVVMLIVMSIVGSVMSVVGVFRVRFPELMTVHFILLL
ncbi:MAG TPA: hypothetical protein VH988_06500 [Thermoanaerobaculia bacterium]|jgi:hypothetical protein|nr:hypothetical protein [Thermoanaerobaculia bacterium]